jgi:hypothetical protein
VVSPLQSNPRYDGVLQSMTVGMLLLLAALGDLVVGARLARPCMAPGSQGSSHRRWFWWCNELGDDLGHDRSKARSKKKIGGGGLDSFHGTGGWFTMEHKVKI